MKSKKILMTNKKIYELTENILKIFNQKSQELPVNLYFIILKNKKQLLSYATEIEESRLFILNKYGTLNKINNTYTFSEEKKALACQELENLLNIKQEIDLFTIKEECLLSCQSLLTLEQIETLVFMIEEEKEGE